MSSQSVVALDHEERRCARDAALRAGEDVLPHPYDCVCVECAAAAAYPA